MPGSNKGQGSGGSRKPKFPAGIDLGNNNTDLSDDIVFEQFDQFTTNQGNYGASFKDQNQVISPVSEVFSCKTGTNDFFGF
jgi:hypothetical protein